ncbi:autotransporter outer membrane beta-barrel domain-containing protein [Pantoea sp. Tr-811]|uniref:autotransporter domain-containing protein n=1 Tax=Pantoea sp. Tr-811 TaxID=2608361 RepID=UPI0014237365|nr:autotransporter outer membrane beta-barrel domain-containing protein [Pantoea sp. Tr-811]NIF26614.1 autotransporter outer membrane beta-barrel domain-containing protein [Pantoea sp. Tr-811]
MNTHSNPLRFDRIFYAVSTSMLLATPVETFASELQEPATYPSAQQQPAMVLRSGTFVGHDNLQGPIEVPRAQVADMQRNAINLSGESQGAYWSLTHTQGWHLDATATGSQLDGGNAQGRYDSRTTTFSVEGGFPIHLTDNWVIEPQAQLVNQRFYPGSQVPVATAQAFDNQPSWSGRVGARLSGRYDVNGMPIEPYVRTNVWYDFSNADEVKLDQVDKISSSRYSTTVELGLGLVARVTPSVALFVSADYSSDVDDNDINGLIASLGIRMRW